MWNETKGDNVHKNSWAERITTARATMEQEN